MSNDLTLHVSRLTLVVNSANFFAEILLHADNFIVILFVSTLI